MRRRLEALRALVEGIDPRTRRRALGGALAVGVAVLVAVSIQAESTTTYELRDSGVWVQREREAQVGRLNAQIAEIDYAADAESTTVLQDGRRAYLVVRGDAAAITQLDAADPGLDPVTVEVPGATEVAVGGGVVAAIVDDDLRIIGRDGILTGVGETVAELGDGALVAVGPTGAVAGFHPASGRLVVLRPDVPEVTTDRIDAVEGEVELTLVGDRPVVLDITGRRLVLPDGGVVDLAELGDDPALQHPGPERGEVLVATSTSLVAIDLDDGSDDVVDDVGAGTALRPAWDGSCAHGAWTGDAGRVVVACDGREPLTESIAGSTWVLRAGGPTVVLNDSFDGTVIVRVDDELVVVTEWPENESTPTQQTTIEQEPPDPTKRTPPVATPDVGDERLGARPGRTTFLQVLRNDFDPDGDVVYVSDLDDLGDERLSIAQGGRSIAIDLSETSGAEGGPIRFRYQISDGELTSTFVAAEVEIVTGDGRSPELITNQTLAVSVEVGRRAQYEVLSAYWDPDGDPIFVAGVTPPAGDHRVDWDSDGWIRFTASNPPGGVGVGFTVRDTTNRRVGGTLTVTVVAAAPTSLPPVARNDFLTATVGSTVTLDPLANDSDPNDDDLSLVDVELLRGSGQGLGRIDLSTTTATVRPEDRGDYVLLYTVSDGTADAQTATATILLRVVDPPVDDDPVAVADVVVVEVGRSAEVDLTRNDVDPLGRLLSVTALRRLGDADSADLLTVGVANDFRTFRVDALPNAEPDTLLDVEYDVSNGSGQATSTVTIVVVAAPGNRPPQTVVPAPVVAVRAGEVATVPLATFAWDPDGDPLTVHVNGPVEAGDARPSGTSIRYFAPASAGGRRITVPVEVREPSGDSQAASIVMDVIRPESNSRPEALDLEARVRRGGEVVIPVPLLGLDPDGDPVRLLGRVGPSVIRGEVVEDHGRQAFVYRATDRTFTGEDTFTYRVVDGLGAESEDATVTVSVTEAGENSPPVAATDRATVRVDGEVWVDPLANDTDLDGDLLELADDGLEGVIGGCRVEAREGRVRVQAGEVAEECTISYEIVDVDPDDPGVPNGPPVAGLILVRVLDVFEGTRPIARDDYAALEGDVDSVRVEVLANDEDPDGLPSDLRVELVDPPPGTSLDRSTDEVVVTVTPEPQIVRYRITDADDLTADAVVRVPGGAENRPPELITPPPDRPTLRADGDPLAIDLADHIFDPDGDAITFSDISSASAVDTTLRSRLAEGVAVFDPISDDLVGLATFQVTATDDAPEPLSRVVTITVEIEQRLNRPPEWKGSPCRPIERVAPAIEVRLGAYVEDPDLDDLTFGGGGERSGVSARVSAAGTLRLEATSSATVGDEVTFTLSVEDPEGARVERSCVVEVLPTSRPPIRAGNGTAETQQGEPVRVDIRPLVVGAQGDITLEPARVESGPGGVTTSGTALVYTSPADFAGEVAVRYTVSDELDAPGDRRRASAVITIRVLGRPAPPEAVVAVSEASASVTVGWRNGSFNGSPVTSFLVRAVDGSASRTCSEGPCTLTATDGIVNGRTYRFTVVAVNDVGESDPSAPSNPVTPNATPGAPIEIAATVVPGDGTRTGQVRFAWTPGPNEGTEVLEYVLAGAVQGGTGSTATTITVSGPNGQEVCLSVAARNAAGEGDRSGRACAVPYGRPIVSVASVQATGRGEGTLVWTADGNGRPITGQSVSGCSTSPATITPSTRTVTLDCGNNVRPTITIEATNEAGLRGATTTSPQLYAPPQILGGFTLTAAKETVTVVRLPPVNPLGRDISEWQARLPGGEWATLLPNRTVSAPAWTLTTLELRACNAPTSCSAPRTADDVTVPFGTPAPPTDLVATRQVDSPDNVELAFTWPAPAEAGGWTFTYEVTWGSGATSGSRFGGLDDQRTITLTGVSPEAQGGTLTICVRDTGTCATTPFEIPAAPP